jgi:hypothetical protein
MDLLGGVFCTLSLVFKHDFDALAAVNYAGIVVLDGGILILAAILNPRANRRRRRLRAADPSEELSSSGPQESAFVPDIEELAGHAPVHVISSFSNLAEGKEVDTTPAVAVSPDQQ